MDHDKKSFTKCSGFQLAVRKGATAIQIELMKVDEDNIPQMKEESFLDLVLRNSKMSWSCSR
jgi:hypothetical protein